MNKCKASETLPEYYVTKIVNTTFQRTRNYVVSMILEVSVQVGTRTGGSV